MLDEFTKKRIDRILKNYVELKIPKEIRNEMKLIYKFRGNNVTLLEERMGSKGDRWIQLDRVQFRFDKETYKWSVYWRDSKDKWHQHPEVEPDHDFEKQLGRVDQDQSGAFWG